jgi:hypothetical protein
MQFPKLCVILSFLEYQTMDSMKRIMVMSVVHPLDSRVVAALDQPISTQFKRDILMEEIECKFRLCKEH